jgi:molybdate transport system substrate-binding protein
MRGPKRTSVVLACVLCLWVTAAYAAEITVAAASDLNFAFKEIVAEFEKKTGNQVKLSLGSSGNFFAQISNGAPFDVFFSADIGYPKKLEEAGLTEPGTLYMYAVGRIVVWVSKDSPIDVGSLGIKALQHPSVKKIAIANPKHAPYGRAAVAAMEYYKIYEAVKDKLVLGENISQTAQFVQTGGADIGVIALSLAVAPAMKETGTYWEVPLEAYPRLEQGAIVLKAAKDLKTARAFLDYIKGPEGTAVFRRYGFILPQQTAQHPTGHDECANLPANSAAVVSAMAKPGTKVNAQAARGPAAALTPAAERFEITLHPVERVSLPAKPAEGPETTAGFAGLLPISVPRDGVFRISLSTHLWLEMLDGDTKLERIRLAPRLHCGTVQKSLGFPLKAGVKYWLQLSGNKSQEVHMVITSE